jgi:hypothetical protein
MTFPACVCAFVAGALVATIDTTVGARRDSQEAQRSALVTVIASGTGPIKDLGPKDFVVYEDNARREVLDATPATDPLSVVLLVDVTTPPSGPSGAAQDLRASLTSFLTLLRAGNSDPKIAVMEFAGSPRMTVDFGASPADVDAAVSRLFQNQTAGAVLLEALEDAARRVGARPAPRRALVSVDFNSVEFSAEKNMSRLVDVVRNAGATLWAATVRGSGTTTPIRETVLSEIARINGGLRLSTLESTGLEQILKTIANSLSSQYVVTFAHPDGKPKATRFETTRGAKVLLSPFIR